MSAVLVVLLAVWWSPYKHSTSGPTAGCWRTATPWQPADPNPLGRTHVGCKVGSQRLATFEPTLLSSCRPLCLCAEPPHDYQQPASGPLDVIRWSSLTSLYRHSPLGGQLQYVCRACYCFNVGPQCWEAVLNIYLEATVQALEYRQPSLG